MEDLIGIAVLCVVALIILTPGAWGAYRLFRQPERFTWFKKAAVTAGLLWTTGWATTFVYVSWHTAYWDESSDGPITGAARSDPIQDFIRERMQPASAAFFAPSPMTRDEPVDAVLEVSPPSLEPRRLEDELRARAGREGVAASDSIKIAPRMIASLVSDRDATIVARDVLDRAIVFGERVTWRWTVTPKSTDPMTLTATLQAPVIYDGHETGYMVKAFERTVVVNVTLGQRLGDVWVWIRDNWIPLAAAVGAVAAIGRWISRRFKRPRPVGFSST